MKTIFITECRSCPFESEDGDGGSYCHIDDEAHGYTSCSTPPEWCPLFNEDVLVQIGDINESEFIIKE